MAMAAEGIPKPIVQLMLSCMYTSTVTATRLPRLMER